MKNFIMTAMAVVLFSATANANTISVKCGDYVQRGTVKLANPPVMNCADLELLQKYLGSGITVGPDSKVEELVAAITSIQPAPKAQPVPPVTTEKISLFWIAILLKALSKISAKLGSFCLENKKELS